MLHRIYFLQDAVSQMAATFFPAVRQWMLFLRIGICSLSPPLFFLILWAYFCTLSPFLHSSCLSSIAGIYISSSHHISSSLSPSAAASRVTRTCLFTVSPCPTTRTRHASRWPRVWLRRESWWTGWLMTAVSSSETGELFGMPRLFFFSLGTLNSGIRYLIVV